MLFALFFFFLRVSGAVQPKAVVAEPTPAVCLGDRCFQVQIADSPDERERGLMYVTHLPAMSGMLFVFDQEGVYPFRMKNTLIPLDMIRINDARQIVGIEQNVPPCKADPCPTYGPSALARYVLEVNGGSLKSWELRVKNVELRVKN